jgi:gluconolactonase
MKLSLGKSTTVIPLLTNFNIDQILRHPARDEVFFVQNAGAAAAGTGLNKSAIIQKISLSDAEKVRNGSLAAVPVTIINTTNAQVINPNGGTNWKGQIIFAGEGQGDNVPPALYIVNPEAPYNTSSKYYTIWYKIQNTAS